MRILVVGAGGTGGYFGGRLLQSGSDVTFLVREKRAATLVRTGLAIRSAHGDADLRSPPTVTAATLREHYDLILLSCKAYDLDGAIEAFAPAVGPRTAILPVLNGMRHLDVLDARFGAAHVLGGLCVISSGLGPDGEILHFNDAHSITFGERDGARSARAETIEAIFTRANFVTRHSAGILQEMWEKFVFISALAGITCLMRAAVGDILAAGAGDLTLALFDECAAIAAKNSFLPREVMVQRSRAMLTAEGSTFTASMLRDIEQGGRTEGDHILGDLFSRGGGGGVAPLLRIAHAHLRSYEARRSREAA